VKRPLLWIAAVLNLAVWFLVGQPGRSTSAVPQQAAAPGSFVQYVPGTKFEQERGTSPAVISSGGKTVWLSGVSALTDSNGKSLLGDFDGQAKEVFAQIDRTLKRAGGSIQDVVVWTVYMNDDRYGQQFGKIRHDMFPNANFPGSARIVVSNFERPGILIEVQAVAVIADRRINRPAAAAATQAPGPLSVQYLDGPPEQQNRGNSAAVVTQGGKTIWLSGMTGGGASGGTFESKARAAFETIQKTLAENGASLKDLVSLKVFIKAAPVNSNDFAKVMRDLFPDGKYPASTVVTVSYSPELIEIQGVAVVAS